MGKTYKIKLEDKAALINALKKIDIGVDSYNITDNELEGYFEISFKNPQDEEDAKSILRSHRGIDQIKEVVKNLVRKTLKERFGN